MAPKQRYSGFAFLQNVSPAALLLPVLLLLGCSAISSSAEDVPASGPDPSYNKLIADLIKSSFKGHASYEDFEISAYRWVHSLYGWAWITCVRFRDKGRQRTYTVYIKGQEIVQNRYAVESDACAAQAYTPFTLLGGAKSLPSSGGLDPLY